MVTLAVIASATEVSEPDLNTIFNYLNEQALPVASAKNTMVTIAPAVYMQHDHARTIQFYLTSENLDLKRLSTSVARYFSRITDLYIILAGIEPPKDPIERIQFDREIDFAVKLLEIVFRLYREIGGKANTDWEPVEISEGRREQYSADLKVLRATYPMPEFAMQHRMTARSEIFAGCGWIFFIIVILLQTGILQILLPAIVEYFSND